MDTIKIPVIIDDVPHTLIARHIESPEYGAITEIRTEGHLLCLDQDLQPLMGHLPDGWAGPVIEKLKEVFAAKDGDFDR